MAVSISATISRTTTIASSCSTASPGRHTSRFPRPASPHPPLTCPTSAPARSSDPLTTMSIRPLICCALLMVTVSRAASWSDYGGTPDQSKFVTTPDLTRESISKLAVAWTYPSGDERAYQFNPVIVDNVMYVLAKNSSLVAIDVNTHQELWIHANLRGITNR